MRLAWMGLNMPFIYRPAKRNYGSRIEFSDIRKRVEPKYADAHDRLSEAYYGYKRGGENTSVIIGGKTIEFNNGRSPQKNKEIFDKYHATILGLQDLEIDKENKRLPRPHRKLRDRLNKKLSREKRKILTPSGGKKRFEITIVKDDKSHLDILQERLNKLKNEGFGLKL